MGWWKISETGLVGDQPLNVLGEAFREVVDLYHLKAGRRPSVEELERLLTLVLSSTQFEGTAAAERSPERLWRVRIAIEELHRGT